MNLKEFFAENKKIALAFSGGTDSAFLLWAAREYGADVMPYFVNSPFQPDFELEDARRLTRELGSHLRVVQANPLDNPFIVRNAPDRCYHCKNAVFSAIVDAAHADGYSFVIDGTNASDDAGDRPGMRALAEMGVVSPLRICGIDKTTVRELSKKAGLFTAKKPSYACLATRIPTGTAINKSDLGRAQRGEKILQAMGFFDFRLRVHAESAVLQLTEADTMLFLQSRGQIIERLSADFSAVYLDVKPRPEGL